MDQPIEVVRYIRPQKYEVDYGYHDNLYGITIVYLMDYSNNTVKASWSICNGDNFDKAIGKEIARSSKSSIIFDIENIRKWTQRGLTNTLILELMDFTDSFWYPGDFEDYLNLFLKASRKISK